jgi:hypothetical protein
MHQHREPANMHTDTPDLPAALRQALLAVIARSRPGGAGDRPDHQHPMPSRMAGPPMGRRHSWLHSASHAAVYTAAGLHLLHRHSHRGH